jgi:hypothetical protein
LVDQQTYDYYQLFSEGAESRWGDMPKVARYKSKEGKKMVEEGWDSTYRDAEEYFKKAKEFLANCKSVDDLLKSDCMERWYLHKLGGYYTGTWLYDNDGSSILNLTHLDDTLEKWKCLYDNQDKKNPYEKDAVWVVPADVHF